MTYRYDPRVKRWRDSQGRFVKVSNVPKTIDVEIVSNVPAIYYDSKIKRWRNSKGQFVKSEDVQRLLPQVGKVWVKSKKGNFYKDNKVIQRTVKKIVYSEEIRKKEITDTFRVDVSEAFDFSEGILLVTSKRHIFRTFDYMIERGSRLYKKWRVYLFFSGFVYDKEGTYLGKYKYGSTQLTEEYHSREHYETVVDDFIAEVNKDVMAFIKSDRRIELDKIVCVFKGWEKI